MRIRPILLSLLLLSTMLFLLAGCGGSTVQTDSEETVMDSVSFSNTKFSDSELSEQEKQMMTDVEKMLADIRVFPTGDSYYLEMFAENTTSYDLRISFYLQALNSDGIICGSSSFFLDEWKSGSKLDRRMDVSADYEISDVRISADYVNASSWYHTDLIRPVFEKQSEENGSVHIQLKQELPYTFSVKNYSATQRFTLTDFSVKSKSGYYSINMMIRKDSAFSDEYTLMEYRLVRDNGVVATDGSVSISYLEPGETMLVTDNYIELDPGDYYFEILESS